MLNSRYPLVGSTGYLNVCSSKVEFRSVSTTDLSSFSMIWPSKLQMPGLNYPPLNLFRQGVMLK